MILNRQSFHYKNRVLIERAVVKPPYKHKRIFQNEGCFLYMKQAEGQVLSGKDQVNLNPTSSDALLLKCDTYFIDFVKSIADKTVEVIAFHLYPDLLQEIYKEEFSTLIKNQPVNPQTKRITNTAVISNFIDSLEFYFKNPSLVKDDLLLLKTKELILLLVQTKNVTSIQELVSDLYTPRTSSIRELVELHQFSNLTVEELAELSNMSVSTFNREFKRQFKLSPIKYFNSEKIESAKQLLKLSELTVAEIAFKVGFNDPLYFSRLFKKNEGISPSEFRLSN